MKNYFSLSLLILALGATPAMAEPRDADAGRVLVRTADLDLGSDSGRRQLSRRLGQAVTQACGTASDADLAGANAVSRCLRMTRQIVEKERAQRIAAASARPIVLAGR
ncbi:MAG TPA: UrcA family protein [Sphingomicrobium sp.]|nr:UrcA family protein [Sphingomicrobium sp.]